MRSGTPSSTASSAATRAKSSTSAPWTATHCVSQSSVPPETRMATHPRQPPDLEDVARAVGKLLTGQRPGAEEASRRVRVLRQRGAALEPSDHVGTKETSMLPKLII